MESKISDNPQYKHLSDQIKMLGCLSCCLPFLFTNEQRRKLRDMRKQVEELRQMPDDFNELFLKHGWVCFGTMNGDLLKQCVALGRAGKIDSAEQLLIDFYQGDICHLVLPLRNTPGFKARYDLFIKAYDDYCAGRYHACVPVFLMIIDGAVNQVLKKNLGLFAENTNLNLYDSDVGHSSGLPSLIKIMSATRKATNTKEVLIPYRNGILHGMDVSYGNVYVATKSLAVLFAVADWIRDYSKRLDKEPIDEEESSVESIEELGRSLTMFAHQIEESNREKEILEKWRPRNFENTDFTSYLLEEGSPEYRVCQFLDFYTKANYGKMAGILTGLKEESDGKMAGEIRTRLNDIKCTGFRIVGIVDHAPAVSEVNSLLSVVVNDVTREIEVKARVLFQEDKVSCRPLVRGDSRGQWYILNTVLYEIERKSMII